MSMPQSTPDQYRFESSPILDLAIFSGCKLNINDICTKQLRERNLQVNKLAKETFENNFNRHQQELQLTYENFLSTLEKNIKIFNNPDPEKCSSSNRLAVASKLSELANKAIGEEAKMNAAQKFWHRIVQFFHGYWGYTKGEWGAALATKMRDLDDKIYVDSVKLGISHSDFQDMHPPEEIIDKIDQLPDSKFQELLNGVIFKTHENRQLVEKYKFNIYNGLKNKQPRFDQLLLARKDWFSQAFDIIEGSSTKEMRDFVSDAMVAKYQENIIKQPEFKLEIKPDENHQQFCYIILAKTIKNFVKNENWEQLGKIFTSHSNVYTQEFTNLGILTQEDVDKIKNNIDYFSTREWKY
jgi:hypothetical protein